MVHDVGPLDAIEAGDRADGPGGAEEPVAAPPPGERAQRKALGANLFAVRPYAGCHDHCEPRRARCPGEGQAMRAEIPVLGYQEEELWRR
jgi:hypothetical protein